MQIIKFIYNSVDVEDSVFLLLYFRILGIYVYEQHMDMAKEVPFLLEGLDDVKVQTDYDCDARIYLLCRPEDVSGCTADLLQLSEAGRAKSVVLVKGDWLDENLNQIFSDMQRIPLPVEEGSRQQLLQMLTEAFYRARLIGGNEKNAFERFAEIYCTHDLYRLTLGTRFFYAKKEWFDEIAGKYKAVYTELLRSLKDLNSQWGDARYVHLQAAVLNLVFDIDIYARKCNEPMPYTPDSCIRVCDKILTEAEGILDDGIRLLQGQIYSELLDKEKDGFDCYLQTCKDYNAYAYFKKALTLEQVNANYEKAVQYYKKSVMIFPEYYRAWNAMGMCYYRMGKWGEALDAFSCVKQILKHKREKKCLRPLEMDYLFQSLRRQGEILADKIVDTPKALVPYKDAENVWNMIEESSFWHYMYQDDQKIKQAQKVIKERLNVKAVYSRLSILNRAMGNAEKAEEYYRLYEEMGS